ncbi:PREDICTED: cysteine-rich secretory protein 2-like, partial [Hipposideros armiger]|uniref:Cysteine-rich secretory protein 2-like n=1 Tax=Hipposideros armiger TaxID=186990 RepID=A0A8B7QRU3_HIPAR
EWNRETASNAQKWANKCTLEHSSAADRKTSMKCGENIFMSSNPTAWSNAIGNNVSKKNTPYQQGTPCASCPDNCEDGLC